MDTTINQPLRRTALRWALGAMAIDILLFVLSMVIWHSSGDQFRTAIGAWVSVHEPAMVVADALLPGLPSAHSSLPLVSYAGFAFLALVQIAAVGGVLGVVYALVRRGQSAL